MFTIMVIVRKKNEISNKVFRKVWKQVNDPMYQALPQVKSYTSYHLKDRRKDESDDPIDGIAVLSFESEQDMIEAWAIDAYKEAAKIREKIMREKAMVYTLPLQMKLLKLFN